MRNRASISWAGIAGSLIVILATAVAPNSAVAAPGASAGHATQRVIVVLRNQLASTPAHGAMTARTARANQTQDAVLARLSGPRASHLVHLSLGNAFIATVTAAQQAALAADPAVASVVADTSVPIAAENPARPRTSPMRILRARRTHAGLRPAAARPEGPFAICPTDPSHPLIEPEGLDSIHALNIDGSPSAQDLSTGSGVKVAFIADGLDVNNPDFIRAGGSHAIIDYQDFSGDGPDAPTGGAQAFGDASAIGGQGTVTYDLSNFVNPSYPLPAGCNITVYGVAPDASIVALKAGGSFLSNSAILQSIDYAVRVDQVNVITEQFGLDEFPDSSNRNTIELFNDQAMSKGVTVIQSAGEGGATGTISGAAADPHVISVGASTGFASYATTGAGGSRFFGNGKWAQDNISPTSSGGFTQFGRTPDLVAPGLGNWGVCEPGFADCSNYQGGFGDVQFDRTDEAAPLTAGVAALVISAYRSAHSGKSPSPTMVKQILTGTAADLGQPPSQQGSGLVDARSATEAALTWPTATSPAPAGVKANLVTSKNQVTLTGATGSTQYGSVQVTNVGTSTLTVATGTRTFAPLGESGQATAFNSSTLPTFPYPSSGAPYAFKKLQFNVPSGAARLVAHMAWAGSRPPAADAIVQLSLFAPDGTFETTGNPQGGAATSNYVNAEVRSPAAGTWTAVLYSPSGSAGYSGVIGLDVQTYRAVAVGSITPATFTLTHGQTKTVNFHFTMPAAATGDQDYAVTLGTSTGHQTAVGVVLRPLIRITNGQGQFSGNMAGGNARPVTPAETFSYQFDVPSGKPSLDASLTINDGGDPPTPVDPGSPVDLVLIDPHGEVADVATNEAPTSALSSDPPTTSPTIQSFNAAPIAGRWVLVVVVQNPVQGTSFSFPFTGTVSFAAVPVQRGGLPNSSSAVLPGGTPTTFPVQVQNTGVEPILVGADPRKHAVTTLQPVPISGLNNVSLPASPSQEPVFQIPPDTNSLTVTANSTTPTQLELQSSVDGFDLFGDLAAARSGNSLSTAKVVQTGTGSFITRGRWSTALAELGPFTDDGQTSGQSTITASMSTQAFDPTVTSDTGDPYGNAVDPSNDGFGTPVLIQPGDTGTVNVTVTPTAATGTLVYGVLNIVTVPNLFAGSTAIPSTTTGEVLAVLPYEYKVG